MQSISKSKIWIWVFVLLPILFLLGCGPNVIRLYPGPELPDDQVATLNTDDPIYVDLSIIKVDGELLEVNAPFGSVTPNIIKMLPCTHEIEWSAEQGGGNWIYQGTGTLNAKAGHIYDIYFGYLPAEPPFHVGRNPIRDWATWIQNRNTAEVVVGNKPLWAETGIAHIYTTRNAYATERAQ